jgi:hypothetical protein
MTSRTSELETRAILNEWALARYQGGLRNSRLAVEPSPTGAGGRNERPARANLGGPFRFSALETLRESVCPQFLHSRICSVHPALRGGRVTTDQRQGWNRVYLGARPIPEAGRLPPSARTTAGSAALLGGPNVIAHTLRFVLHRGQVMTPRVIA